MCSIATFAEAKLVLICKKQYTDMLKTEGFLIPETYQMKSFIRRNAVPALLEWGTAFSVFVGFMHGKCIYTEKRSKIFI